MPDATLNLLILALFIFVVLRAVFRYEDKRERKAIAKLVSHGLEESEAAAIVRQHTFQ